MVIDGEPVGRRMGADLIAGAFRQLSLDFAAVDRDGALAALARIELSIADALAVFREHGPKGIVPYDAAFDAMLETVSSLVQEARDAVQSGSKPA